MKPESLPLTGNTWGTSPGRIQKIFDSTCFRGPFEAIVESQALNEQAKQEAHSRCDIGAVVQHVTFGNDVRANAISELLACGSTHAGLEIAGTPFKGKCRW